MKIIIASACLGIALIASGCFSNKSDEKSEGMMLFDEAKVAVETGNADLCLMLLDSLDHNYSADTEAARNSIMLRPRAIELQSIQQISANDSVIKAEQCRVDSMMPLMKKISLRAVDGYWVDKASYNPDFMNSTGISGRVSEIGEFYIVSCVNGGKPDYNSIVLEAGDAKITSQAVSSGNARNYSHGGARIISFTPAESDPLGEFVVNNRLAKSLTVRFNGRGNRSVKLTSKQIDGIATAYLFAKAVNALRSATINGERLQKRLEMSRRQQISTTQQTQPEQQ